MRKFFFVLVLVIFVLFFIALFYINANASSIISRFLSKQLKTEITVEKASLGIRELTLYNIEIPKTLTIERAEILFDPFTFFKDTLTIDKITLTNPVVMLQFKNLKENNWTALIEPLDKEPAPKKSTRKLIIDTLVLNNLQIKAVGLSIPLKDQVVLHDLSEHKALAYKQAMALILEALIEPLTKTDQYKEIVSHFQKLIPDADSTEWEQFQDELEKVPKKVSNFLHKYFSTESKE